MKKTLAIAAIFGGALAINAANPSFSILVKDGSGTQIGSGTGKYILSGTYAGKITLAGSFTSADTIVSGYLQAPSGGSQFNFSVSSTAANTWFFHFLAPVAVNDVNFVANADNYVAKFFKAGSSTPVITSPTHGSGLTVVPETQTYALVAGSALMGFAAFRRARR